MGMPPDSGERSVEVLYEILNTLNEIKALLEKITTPQMYPYSGLTGLGISPEPKRASIQ